MTRKIPLAEILTATAAQAGLTRDDLAGRTPRADVFRARDRAVLVARRVRPEFSSPFLGGQLGGRDHTTILDCEHRAERRLGDPAEAAAVADILARLGLDHLPEPDRKARSRIDLTRELKRAETYVETLRAQLTALDETPAAEVP